jgi:hypothetical protein
MGTAGTDAIVVSRLGSSCLAIATLIWRDSNGPQVYPRRQTVLLEGVKRPKGDADAWMSSFYTKPLGRQAEHSDRGIRNRPYCPNILQLLFSVFVFFCTFKNNFLSISSIP